MTPIRTLIVDDEIHARRGLKTLLANEPDVEVAGEAACGDTAVAAIRRLKPDLVLLDMQMPVRNGLDVVARIGADAMPPVIFVTAYDQYAVPAFGVNAVDYLLKPFTDERFGAAMNRARRVLDQQAGAASPAAAPDDLERFTVKVGDMLKVFTVDEIDWVEADRTYVKLHINGEVHLVRQTMTSIENRLPGDRFARIHRSAIVNLSRITALEPLFQGDYTVLLADGTELRMSRRRREALAGRLAHLS